MTLARAQYERFRQLLSEFAKFAVIGVTGVFISGLDRSLSGLTGAAAMTITPPAGGSPAG